MIFCKLELQNESIFLFNPCTNYFDWCINSYVYEKKKKKIRDEKGKPIKKTDTKEELELYKKYFLSKSYIQFKDFTILADLYFKGEN